MKEIVVDTVKLVIDVPKEVYEKQKYAQYFGAWSVILQKHFENGTPLDKIMSEIEALNPVDYVSMSSYEGHKGASDMKNDVLQIIGKYEAESEGDKE